MAKEASKTNCLRDPSFFLKYLQGRILDIGAGSDPIVPHAEIFDQHQGDANNILEYLHSSEYDTVHSSHCLEHMYDPIKSLSEWWSLVKPGGFMITVVPHEDLYEQFNWPSIFNEDHKSTFRLGGETSWSPVSIDLLAACQNLSGCVVLEKTLWDTNFDYDLLFPRETKPRNRRDFLNRQISSVARRVRDRRIRKKIFEYQLSRGYPIDQTAKSDALAQIEIVCQKI